MRHVNKLVILAVHVPTFYFSQKLQPLTMNVFHLGFLFSIHHVMYTGISHKTEHLALNTVDLLPLKGVQTTYNSVKI